MADTDPLVSPAVLRHITGERTHEGQARVLRRMGVPLRLNPAGAVLLTVGVLDRWIEASASGGDARRARPRLEAVDP